MYVPSTKGPMRKKSGNSLNPTRMCVCMCLGDVLKIWVNHLKGKLFITRNLIHEMLG